MKTIAINQLINALDTGVENLAESTLKDYLSTATADGRQLVGDLKSSLEQWTAELADGSLTQEDLAFLLKEQASLTEMTSLKQAGLGEVRADQFKNDLISMVTNTVFSLV
ncbi:hypothetical protein GS399_04970 [Pedobacter sp. HMF7647]|uniref:Uncharacterized protein n=1 Tax=Hufsiella arboris TaxID=2695275 RepID=A0A7K1Y6X3_9SPHI|nr:hypothetical protein [Hufsiella arboris]MXV50315.1 hypothetical protein [Hufsiella arboris]